MKKVFLSLAIVAMASLSATAQKSDSKSEDVKISIGGTIGLPVGDLSPYTSLAYGGDLQAEFPVASNFGVTVSAGYLSFTGKNGFTTSGGLIPVLVGGRYYFDTDSKVYGSLQAGLSFGTESGAGSAFTFAPGVGYKVSENFDLLLKYQSASKNGSDNSFIGVRAAYIF